MVSVSQGYYSIEYRSRIDPRRFSIGTCRMSQGDYKYRIVQDGSKEINPKKLKDRKTM